MTFSEIRHFGRGAARIPMPSPSISAKMEDERLYYFLMLLMGMTIFTLCILKVPFEKKQLHETRTTVWINQNRESAPEASSLETAIEKTPAIQTTAPNKRKEIVQLPEKKDIIPKKIEAKKPDTRPQTEPKQKKALLLSDTRLEKRLTELKSLKKDIPPPLAKNNQLTLKQKPLKEIVTKQRVQNPVPEVKTHVDRTIPEPVVKTNQPLIPQNEPAPAPIRQTPGPRPEFKALLAKNTSALQSATSRKTKTPATPVPDSNAPSLNLSAPPSQLSHVSSAPQQNKATGKHPNNTAASPVLPGTRQTARNIAAFENTSKTYDPSPAYGKSQASSVNINLPSTNSGDRQLTENSPEDFVVIKSTIQGTSDRITNMKREIYYKAETMNPDNSPYYYKINGFTCKVTIISKKVKHVIIEFTPDNVPFDVLSSLERRMQRGGQ